MHFIMGIILPRHHTQAVIPDFSLQTAGRRLMLTHRIPRQLSKKSSQIWTA
jgi:hypothetical protein